MAFNLDQSFEGSTDGNTGNGIYNLRRAADNNIILGQSFTPVLSGPLNKVELRLQKEGAPTGNIWVEIHADGVDPSAAAQLGADSATVDVSTVSTYAYIAFTWATSITLNPGTKYWILLYGDYTIQIDVGVYWAVDTTSPSYAGGNGGRYGDGTPNWEDISTYDAHFKQYSDNPTGGYFGGKYY